MTLTVQDLQQLQAEHPEWRMELVDGEVLTGPDLLPGWEVAVSDLWPPVFE